MTPLYAPLLAPFLAQGGDTLPGRVREFHLSPSQARWVGMCEVRHGRGLLPGIARWVLRLPKEGTGVALSVEIQRRQGAEIWTRRFGDRVLRTRQSLGRQGTLREAFGPLTIDMDLKLRGARLYLEPRRWAFLGVPLPRRLRPGGNSFETQEGAYFHFDVEYRVPLIGLIASYKGSLLPQD